MGRAECGIKYGTWAFEISVGIITFGIDLLVDTMKNRLLRWSLRLGVTCVFLLGSLVAIVLNPGVLYARRTLVAGYAVYHSQPLDLALTQRLTEATHLLKGSPLFDAKVRLNVCLNDGSKYPNLIRTLLGPAFGWGFDKNVVLGGEADYARNRLSLEGSADGWNLSQLLAHEAMHCHQVHHFGFWQSNPVKGYPAWKWEGYPEYVARRAPDQQDFNQNLRRLTATPAETWWMVFADGSGTIKPYYRYWMLMQYCRDVKKMTYEQVLADTTAESRLEQEMYLSMPE